MQEKYCVHKYRFVYAKNALFRMGEIGGKHLKIHIIFVKMESSEFMRMIAGK